MKTTIKILLIVISIIVSVGAILYYIDTVMRPPQTVEYQNQFLNELVWRIDEIPEKGNTINSSDYLYKKIRHKVQLYYNMKYITENEKDRMLEIFMAEYIPVFLNQSFALFRRSTWNENDHVFMTSRIKEIKSIVVKRNGNSQPLIESKSSASIQMLEVDNVIDSYNEAKKIMSQTSFNGINTVNNKIKRARELREMEYLSNCTNIVNGLKDLPSKIHNSHYTFLEGLNNQLTNWYNYSFDDYQEKFKYIDKQVTEYEENANKLYGSKKNLESLKNKLVSSYLNGIDNLAWRSARDINTTQSYNWYLENFSNGQYTTQARDAIRRLSSVSSSSQTQRYSNNYNSYSSPNKGYSGNYKFVTTTRNKVPLREWSNVNSPEIYQCPQNATVYVIDNSGDVYFRVHVNGYTGYISKGYLNRQR
ncbi:hypothetical protein EZS27_007263 [termite gut metagenome]|uniref:SH3b domain-containing protein n=1 Tax=termite gut metagenome TaxID=433724 RepID=A0A5J4SG60_9ZZZZ